MHGTFPWMEGNTLQSAQGDGDEGTSGQLSEKDPFASRGSSRGSKRGISTASDPKSNQLA